MVKPSMLNALINKLTPHYQNLKYKTVFLILFVVSLFIRLPFFFRDYIDRDESTFILMGQSWVDGHLPYTELWDLKPPITYLFFAGIIYAFGKSFLAIRLIGALIVAITAFYTYKISLTATTKKVSLWAAIGCVAHDQTKLGLCSFGPCDLYTLYPRQRKFVWPRNCKKYIFRSWDTHCNSPNISTLLPEWLSPSLVEISCIGLLRICRCT